MIEGNEYQFRVIAINKAGQSKPSDASKNFIAKPRFLAPKIDRRHLRDVTISAGATLKLEAAITGEPAPAVEWRWALLRNIRYHATGTIKVINMYAPLCYIVYRYLSSIGPNDTYFG